MALRPTSVYIDGDIKYCIYHILVVYSYVPIQYYLGTHNMQTLVTPQRIWFLQADDNSSTNMLDFNQYTINSGEP
jgi:hypothetical protein